MAWPHSLYTKITFFSYFLYKVTRVGALPSEQKRLAQVPWVSEVRWKRLPAWRSSKTHRQAGRPYSRVPGVLGEGLAVLLPSHPR